MAPVIQDQKPSTDRASGSGQKRQTEKQKELVVRVKYQNTLPDIPFDPKFLVYPFDTNRFVEYKPTSLEKNYKYDLLTEHDLGITIDLINPDAYAEPPPLPGHAPGHPPLHPDDEKILEEETQTTQDSKRSKHHNKIVPWLKKTEYISTEFNRYGASSEKTETKVGYNVRKQMKEETLYMDRDSQIDAINKTFEDAKKEITKHHSKPGVTPVEVMSVFPDFQLWKYPFAQVQFDADPALETQNEEMSQALIRGLMDENQEQYVGYFLPTQETLEKRRRDREAGLEYMEDETYEYKMAREYNPNIVKGFEEAYFFVQRNGMFFYNELETRVRLTKRRVKAERRGALNSWVIVKHRPINELEEKTHNNRNKKIQPPTMDEEEEEEEEGVEAESQQDQEDVDTKVKQNGENDEDKSDNEQGEDVKPPVKKEKKNSESSSDESSSSSSSSDSSDGDSSSSASSSSESDSEPDTKKKKTDKPKSTAQEIFGDSDSD